MKKEEILEKARKDDDEIEQLILTRSLGFSTIIIPIMCILFIVVRILNSEYMISDLVSITLAQLTISEIYQAFKIKKPILFVIGMITLIFTIIFIISFLNEVII